MNTEDWIFGKLVLNPPSKSKFGYLYPRYVLDTENLGLVPLGKARFSEMLRSNIFGSRCEL